MSRRKAKSSGVTAPECVELKPGRGDGGPESSNRGFGERNLVGGDQGTAEADGHVHCKRGAWRDVLCSRDCLGEVFAWRGHSVFLSVPPQADQRVDMEMWQVGPDLGQLF